MLREKERERERDRQRAWEWKRERQRQSERARGRERARESVCMCVCVWERERETDKQRTATESLAFSCFFHGSLIQSSLKLVSHLVPFWPNAQTTWLVYPGDCSTRLAADSDWPLGLKFSFIINFWTTHTFFLPALNLRKSSHTIQVVCSLSLVYFKTQLHIQFLKSILTGQSKFRM